jgi:hypothetical protein
VDEIDNLRNEARRVLASIRRPLSPLKELRIRHQAGWLVVLADRMERDRIIATDDQPSPPPSVASSATAEVLNVTPCPVVVEKNRTRQAGKSAEPISNSSLRDDRREQSESFYLLLLALTVSVAIWELISVLAMAVLLGLS